MRLIRDAVHAKEQLLQNRGLGLDKAPSSLSASITKAFGEPLSPAQVVDRIVKKVRGAGDEAVRELTYLLDGKTIESFEVPYDELERAVNEAPSELMEAMRFASDRIRRFHSKSMPPSMDRRGRRVRAGVQSGGIGWPVRAWRHRAVGLHCFDERGPRTRRRRRRNHRMHASRAEG